MHLFLKYGLIVVGTTLVFLIPIYFFWYKPKFNISETDRSHKVFNITSASFSKIKAMNGTLKSFAHKNHCNEELFFLIDMSIPSGKQRFFVFAFQKDSILMAGLVAHGSCDNGFSSNPVFSNKINSGCSSLGKFKVGNSYTGNFGTSYKLYGLDSSNSNAFKRNVVLHSYDCVPEKETDPLPICNSRGCPMVSPGFMAELKPIINKSAKPVLVWIFY